MFWSQRLTSIWNEVRKSYPALQRNLIKMSATNECKKARKNMMKIGTHNGVFHCDEVLACFMLKQLEEYEDSDIVRTRDTNLLKECDIVVDVGGEYNETEHRYDHHQRDFQHTLSTLRPDCGSNWKIRLSSAGLVYTHFGERVIQSILQKETGSTLSDEALQIIYLKVYEHFIQEIDGIDNGVPMFEGEPAYRITTNLSSRIANFNPAWNATDSFDEDETFNQAMSYAGKEFIDKLVYYSKTWWPARALVKKYLLNRSQVHSSGEIIELEQSIPWKEHLFDLEQKQAIEGVVKYIIFQDKSGAWRVQAVPVQPASFMLRKPLLKEWWGQRDNQLAEVSGIPGTIFCHATGFIGGNQTKVGALEMAVRSLAAVQEQ